METYLVVETRECSFLSVVQPRDYSDWSNLRNTPKLKIPFLHLQPFLAWPQCQQSCLNLFNFRHFRSAEKLDFQRKEQIISCLLEIPKTKFTSRKLFLRQKKEKTSLRKYKYHKNININSRTPCYNIGT